jgi:hypothetical protein
MYARPIATALKSAILPGWGELSLGNNIGYVFLSTEVALWSSMFYFEAQSDLKIKQSKQFALNRGNILSHDYDDEIWFFMERFDRSGFEVGGYNASVVATAMERFPGQPDLQSLYIQENILDNSIFWDWETRENRAKYRIMRKESANFLDYSKAVSGTIILNHVISFFHTMRLAQKSEKSQNIHIYTMFDKNMTPYLYGRIEF